MCKELYNTFKITLNYIWSACKFYLFWTIIHYIIANTYHMVCAPKGVWGFIASPILVISPHCKAIQWLFNISIQTINNMWVVFGIWISGIITGIFKGVQ